ncbi:two pore domain potassium channel family protein [Polymorphobacter arshaanensis]|uniref:Two pore domain potassium channel family protein n=1 Tax=Glacieibacterium arshaanense TaxID=2511025 RepID=A0A4Y9ERZ7_9SPHN|nr:ion channel [Polymorphobacter arshaanensis]TFU06421.1 two pore domain potassium channel family protein [Polymorphobacter arshaanensis]
MLTELAIATAMVMATVMVHAVGLLVLNEFSYAVTREEHREGIHPLSVRGVAMIMALVLGLFVVHGLEIWLYATLYLELGAVEGLRHAVYFSTQTYAAIGYSDEAIAHDWKLIAAIEGINGLLLIGWSTAFFVTIMGRFGRH